MSLEGQLLNRKLKGARYFLKGYVFWTNWPVIWPVRPNNRP